MFLKYLDARILNNIHQVSTLKKLESFVTQIQLTTWRFHVVNQIDDSPDLKF